MSAARRHPLASFFVLTFAISWAFFVPLALVGRNLSFPVTALVIIAGGFGPLIAALIISAVSEGRAGPGALWRRIKTFRVGGRWYIFVLAFPIVLAFATYWLYVAAGGTKLDAETTPPFYLYVPSLINVFFLGGGQEEPGWRGFALPRLQSRYSALKASIILGAVWGLWHLPLFFVPGSSQSPLPLPWYLPHTIALAIIFTWLFNNSRGSVFLAMLLHAGLNAATGWLPLSGVSGAAHPLVILVALEWGVAIVLLLRYGPGDLSRTARVTG